MDIVRRSEPADGLQAVNLPDGCTSTVELPRCRSKGDLEHYFTVSVGSGLVSNV